MLEVTNVELATLLTDPTDRLHVLSPAWAAAAATPVNSRADGIAALIVAAAEPGRLMAMRLQIDHESRLGQRGDRSARDHPPDPGPR